MKTYKSDQSSQRDIIIAPESKLVLQSPNSHRIHTIDPNGIIYSKSKEIFTQGGETQ